MNDCAQQAAEILSQREQEPALPESTVRSWLLRPVPGMLPSELRIITS